MNSWAYTLGQWTANFMIAAVILRIAYDIWLKRRKKMTERKPMDQKTPEIKAAIEGIFPGTAQAIAEKKCPTCRKPIGEFKNELSKREYLISGMCQECQDNTFGPDNDT